MCSNLLTYGLEMHRCTHVAFSGQEDISVCHTAHLTDLPYTSSELPPAQSGIKIRRNAHTQADVYTLISFCGVALCS